MMESNILLAFGLTLFAGLSTGIGGAMAFFTKTTNTKFLAVALGFSAGVMIYISFVEIFVEAKNALVATFGETQGYWFTILIFFIGMGGTALLDILIPHWENPHEVHKVEEMEDETSKKSYFGQRALFKTGIFTALAVAIHNFPEGLISFTSAMQDPNLGIMIAFAIAIHNIPEGIAVSIPIYYATGNKKKAFFYSLLSGLAEPLGAVLGYFLLMTFFNELTNGIVLALVSGIMVFISLDELLPAAQRYGEHHLSIYGLMAGMALMAVSLVLMS